MLLERFRQPFIYALILFVVIVVLLGWNSVLMVLVFLAIGNDTIHCTVGRSTNGDKKAADPHEAIDPTTEFPTHHR